MKKNLMSAMVLGAGVALTVGSVQPTYALNVLRAPAQSVSDIAEKISQWGLNGDLRLLKTDFFDGIGIKAGYGYKVTPSFNDGLFTRYDRYYLNSDGAVGSLTDREGLAAAKDNDFGVGLSLINDLELTFARQFEDAKDALLARPYFYKNIPFNSEKALKGMNVGDYFSMKTKLGVVVSGSFLQGLGAKMLLDFNAHYLIQGSFQVHALRLPDDKLRLKLVGLRSSEKGVSAGVGFEGVLKVFKVNYVDRRITSLLQLDPVKLAYNNGKNDLFMVDYIVNLKDEATQRAYNNVVRNALDLKEIAKTIRPTVDLDELKNSLVMDIEPLDQINRQDIANNSEGTRVTRSFKGSLESKYSAHSLDLGIRLIRLSEGRDYSENKIVSVNDSEQKEYYRLNSYNAKTENGFFFSWLRMQKKVRMNAVLRTNKDFNHPEPQDLVISVERKDKRFRDIEFKRDVVQQMARTVPDMIANKIDYSGWQSNGKKRNNVAVRYQVVIHPEAIDAAPEMNASQIYDSYLNYLRKIDVIDLIRAAAIRHENGVGKDITEIRFGSQVRRIAQKLAKALDKKNSGVDRLNALMDLRHEQLFLKTGVRYLLELLPQTEDKLQSLIRFDLDIESSDGDRVKYSFGDRQESEIYRHLLAIQNLISNDGLDMRLESETLKINLAKKNLK